MGKPAARVGDMHMCPMATPGVPPIPHVGGPITGPGCATVTIGGQPAAVMGDMCVCTGPPDTILLGSSGVFIGGKPAARVGDQCAHGGAIMVGCPTVLIGEVGGGGSSVSGDAMVAAGKAGHAMKSGLAAMPADMIKPVIPAVPAPVAVTLAQAVSLKEAAQNGTALVHNPCQCPACLAKTS